LDKVNVQSFITCKFTLLIYTVNEMVDILVINADLMIINKYQINFVGLSTALFESREAEF
jgi:hypothetical protein